VTAINGTEGFDYIDNSENGDFEIFAKGGDDLIAVRRQAVQVGSVTVDGGAGNDAITIQVYGGQSVIAHGGAGNDVFTLVSGGVVYGDAGADIFKNPYLISGSSGASVVADFQADDKVDMSDYLKTSTSWISGTDPFAGGYLRLVQFGADVMVQAKNGAFWSTMMALASVQASALTSAQFMGFTPKVEAVPGLTISLGGGAVREGSTATFDVKLTQAAAADVTVTLYGKITSSSVDSSAFVSVTIPAGQTSATLSTRVVEDASSDVASYNFGIWSVSSNVVLGASYGARNVFGAVVDNDKNGFSVSVNTAASAYRAMTLLGDVKSQDNLAVTLLDLPKDSTRDTIRALEAYALPTTSVALTAYQFFTGKSPGAAGLKYLVNSPDNSSDLNDAGGIYAVMNTENRYINFAANLGLVGEGKAAFQTAYGALTFRAAIEKAYDVIIGNSAAAAAGINVKAAIDGIVASQGYFDALATQRMAAFDHDLAMKAGVVGYLMAEGLKAHIGNYARAVENFYLDLVDGSAQHNVDLVAVYGPGAFLDSF
jgi:hypothetical protein